MPFAKWRAGWIARHPNWEHRFYDDAAIRRVIVDRAPQWESTYVALPRMIQRVDFFRYLIVYLDGGLYADIDMISYLPCDPLLKGASCVVVVENHFRKRRQATLRYAQPWQLGNFIFAAAPGHPLLGAVLEEIGRSATKAVPDDDSVEDITGPRMLTRLACTLPPGRRGPVRVLPQVNWNPPLFYRRVGPLKARIYARHACAGSWRSAGPRFRGLRHALGRRLPDPFAMAGPEMPQAGSPLLAADPNIGS